MTREELIALGKHKVRNNSDLMRIYISLFTESFGYCPNCAGCTFSNDWQKFVSSDKVSKQNLITMDKTFRLKRNVSEIIAYKKDRKTYRSYANKASEDFMIQFLTNGTESEIEERKKLFAVLPTYFTETTEDLPVKKTRKPRTKNK